MPLIPLRHILMDDPLLKPIVTIGIEVIKIVQKLHHLCTNPKALCSLDCRNITFLADHTKPIKVLADTNWLPLFLSKFYMGRDLF